MAAFVDVQLGTDGLRDWVQVPDGTRYLLGTVSMAKLVAELAPSGQARRTLDAFVAGDPARVRVDVDRLFALLAPRQTRMAAGVTFPLIPAEDRTSATREGTIMADNTTATKTAISQQAAQIESHIALLNTHVKAGSTANLNEGVAKLSALIATLGTDKVAVEAEQQTEEQQKQAQDQGQQQAQEQDKQAAAAAPVGPASTEKTAGRKMSFDNLKANTAIVDETLRTIEAANGKIDRLVTAGKKFNAARAKADLHKVAARVTDIVASVDLANGWVRDDLAECAKSASDIAALFPADA